MENLYAHPTYVESGDILADCTWGAIALLVLMFILVSPILLMAQVIQRLRKR